MSLELTLQLATIAASIGGAFWVTKWRLDRAEKDRADDLSNAAAVAKEIWSAINSERRRVDDIKEAQHKHELEALQERLAIERRFGDQALSHNTLQGDMKNSVEIIKRVEVKVDSLVKDMNEKLKEMNNK